jgi:hypothetical protein
MASGRNTFTLLISFYIQSPKEEKSLKAHIFCGVNLRERTCCICKPPAQVHKESFWLTPGSSPPELEERQSAGLKNNYYNGAGFWTWLLKNKTWFVLFLLPSALSGCLNRKQRRANERPLTPWIKTHDTGWKFSQECFEALWILCITESRGINNTIFPNFKCQDETRDESIALWSLWTMAPRLLVWQPKHKTLRRHQQVNGNVIGCAFRALTFQPDGSIQDDVTEILENWPWSPGLKSEKKAPSEISFATPSAEERQWGFHISPGVPKLILTKLQLEQQGRIVELKSILNALTALKGVYISGIDQNNGLARAYSKEPEQVVAEYLRGVREWLVETLPQYYDSAAWLSTIPIDLVVTVPSVSI